MWKNSEKMKQVVLSGIIVLCILIYGCSNMNDVDWSEMRMVEYDREIVIPLNRSVRTIDKKFIVKFDSVLTDSRCPDGLMCFWSGVAGIRLIISEDSGMNKSVELYTLNNINWSDSVVYQDLKIKLKALNPYPSIYKQFDNKSYKATLILSKTK